MVSASPFNTSTLSLFGISARGISSQSKAIASGVEAARPVSKSADTPSTVSGSSGSGKDINDGSERISKALADYEVSSAIDKKIAAEKGYLPRVNSALIGSYEQAKSGNFSAPNLSTKDDAFEFANAMGARLSGTTGDYAFRFEQTTAVYYGMDVESYGTVRADQLQAKYADSMKADEMETFTYVAALSKAFGLAQPVSYKVDAGKITFEQTDISYGGQPFFRVNTDGSVAMLNANGDPETMNKRV